MNIENKTPKTEEVKFEEILESVVTFNTKAFITECSEMHLRVCAYARVSTNNEEQKTSYDSQIIHYESMIKSNVNWEFVEVYADEGITGTQLKKRDNFNRMIQDALDGKIDMIITKSISRFARNTVDTLNIVRLLRSHGVDVYFEKENIHTISITNELFLTLYSAFAQGESESISENMKGGIQYKMQRGECVGNPNCYGYIWNEQIKELIINEKEAVIVIRIFEEYADGIGTTVIARKLNNDGIPSPTGKKWRAETVRRIICNEKYVGDLRSGKSFVESVITHKRKINTGQTKQFYTTDHHTPIVSRELWNKAQEIYKIRSSNSKKSRDKYSRRYPFSSKIYCGCCGERFTRKSYLKNKNNPKGERVIFWGCRSRDNDIECENHITYKESELENIFLMMYNQLYKNKDKYVETFLQKISYLLDEKNIEKERINLEKEKEKIINKQSKLIDLLVEENITKEILNSKMEGLNTELKSIEKRLNEIKTNEKTYQKKTSKLEKIVEILENKKQLEEFDSDVFESVVERIIIGEKLEDGTLNYKTIKFILKTGDTISGGIGIENVLNTITESTKESKSTLNVNIKKVEETTDGLTAYMHSKRSCICRRKMVYK